MSAEILALGKYLWLPIMAVFGYFLKKRDNKIDELEKQLQHTITQTEAVRNLSKSPAKIPAVARRIMLDISKSGRIDEILSARISGKTNTTASPRHIAGRSAADDDDSCSRVRTWKAPAATEGH